MAHRGAPPKDSASPLMRTQLLAAHATSRVVLIKGLRGGRHGPNHRGQPSRCGGHAVGGKAVCEGKKRDLPPMIQRHVEVEGAGAVAGDGMAVGQHHGTHGRPVRETHIALDGQPGRGLRAQRRKDERNKPKPQAGSKHSRQFLHL